MSRFARYGKGAGIADNLVRQFGDNILQIKEIDNLLKQAGTLSDKALINLNSKAIAKAKAIQQLNPALFKEFDSTGNLIRKPGLLSPDQFIDANQLAQLGKRVTVQQTDVAIRSSVSELTSAVDNLRAAQDDLARAVGDDAIKNATTAVARAQGVVNQARANLRNALKSRKFTDLVGNQFANLRKRFAGKTDDASRAADGVIDDAQKVADDAGKKGQNATDAADDLAEKLPEESKTIFQRLRSRGGLILGILGVGAFSAALAVVLTPSSEQECLDKIPEFSDIPEKEREALGFTNQLDVDNFYNEWCQLEPEERQAMMANIINEEVENRVVEAVSNDEKLADSLIEPGENGGDGTDKSWFEQNSTTLMVAGLAVFALIIILVVVVMISNKKPADPFASLFGSGYSNLNYFVNMLAGNMLPY